jgi:uncharacterized metal-binding protein YceD (DUF177 family)
MIAPELSRPLTLDAARRTREAIDIVADEAERAALARRFDLLALDRLTATLTIAVNGHAISVSGVMIASATQSCVATGEPVVAAVTVPIALKLLPAADLEVAEAAAEVELAGEDLDVVDYDGSAIDLGEIVAQSLALALDPWPRHPDADAMLRAAGVMSEAEAGAFGALAGLRDKLRGQD